MKNYIFGLIACAILVGCSLDESPYNISSEQLAQSEQGAEQLVTGIYACFWDTYMMGKTYMEWIDMDHDHAGAQSWVMSGAGEGNVTTHWGYNNSSDLWTCFYLMVSRTNKAIEALEAAENFESDAALRQLCGEALFMRAFSYFHLVRMYGPCPLRLKYIDDIDKERASVVEVMTQIATDLENAISLMGYKSEGAVGAWGHPDKTAAQLLLARVYCTMGSYSTAANGAKVIVDINGTDTEITCDAEAVEGYKSIDAKACYQKANDLCDQILARKGIDFDLRACYTDIWGSNNARNKEFVWGVNSDDNTHYQTEHLHYYYSPSPFGGRGVYAGMAPQLYNQYEKTDDRIVYGIFHWFVTSYSNIDAYGWVPFPNASESPQDAMPDKLRNFCRFYGNFAKSSPFHAKWYNGDLKNPEPLRAADAANKQDIPLLRFAEVYLLKAEALTEMGKTDEAIDNINVIRKRANASEYEKGIDQLTVRSLVLKERGLELCAEFNRKFDLLRWGLYLDVMNGEKVVTFYGAANSKIRERKNLLYAVPTAEVSENKLFGPNNFGW